MGAGVPVVLEVVGDSEDADNDSLMQWLRSERDLSYFARMRTADAGEGRFGLSATELTVLLVRENVGRFVDAITAFLTAQRRSVSIKVTLPDGRVFEIEARNLRVEEVSRLLSAALAETPGGGGLPDRGVVSGDSVHGDKFVQYQPGILNLSEGASRKLASAEAVASTLPITIYLSDEEYHSQVETAVEDLLAVAGLFVTHRDDAVFGSWFRRMWAAAKEVMRTPPAREAAMVAAHAAETRLVLAQDAAVTATLLQNVGPVITSLQPTKDAVVRGVRFFLSEPGRGGVSGGCAVSLL